MSEYMEGRLTEFEENLRNFREKKGLKTIEISNFIRAKNMYGASAKFSNEELAFAFEYYQRFIVEANKYVKYIPTKKNFCAFLGISSATYSNYLLSDDSERRELMMMIDDYITDTMLTSAQQGEIREITSMYRTKAEHNMIEATAPTVVIHREEANINEINRQLEAIKQGKSLKTIELDKKDYDVK